MTKINVEPSCCLQSMTMSSEIELKINVEIKMKNAVCCMLPD